jgi:hypothetical protein
LESRREQYQRACKREAEAVEAFRKEMKLDTEEDEGDGWNGFDIHIYYGVYISML